MIETTLLDNYQGKIYNVAIYCRLSNDDGDIGESNSIKNQKALLTKYVLEKGWNIAGIYTDDGFSGLYFDRPGFKQMLNDINQGKISLVLAKDMSRLGRDYIQVGYYIEKFFPENKVRFIALNDNIDTEVDAGNNDIAPFKAIINDMYSKDISRKVRSVFNIKRQKGEFIGSFAPYGYEKHPFYKNRLVIDQEAAIVVKRMFEMYLSGHGLTAIANKLNAEGILNPSHYKKKKFENYNIGRTKISKWNHMSVKSILINPVYTGSVTQNKHKRLNYKSKKLQAVHKKDWIMVENTHDPIVTVEEFEQVQLLMASKNFDHTVVRGTTKLFTGFVFCGDCGEYMTYIKTNNDNCYLICSAYKRFGKKQCTRHAILEEKLQEMLLSDFRSIVQRCIDQETIEREAQKLLSSQKKKAKTYQDEMLSIEKKIEELKAVTASLYKDKVRGVIDDQHFLEIIGDIHQERTHLINRYNELHHKSNTVQLLEESESHIHQLVDSVIHIQQLDRLILSQLIQKIEIFSDENIKIHYTFKPIP